MQRKLRSHASGTLATVAQAHFNKPEEAQANLCEIACSSGVARKNTADQPKAQARNQPYQPRCCCERRTWQNAPGELPKAGGSLRETAQHHAAMPGTQNVLASNGAIFTPRHCGGQLEVVFPSSALRRTRGEQSIRARGQPLG